MKLDHVAIWAVDIELMRTFYEKYFDARSNLFPLLDGPRRTGDGYYESMVADPEGNRIVIAE